MIKVSKYKDHDFSRLFHAIEKKHGKGTNKAFWKWKFESRPNPSLVLVAENKKTIVGQYVIQINYGQYLGHEYFFYYPVDIFIQETYRQQGFIGEVLKNFPDDNYIHLGFVNSNSLPAHQKYFSAGNAVNIQIPILSKKINEFSKIFKSYNRESFFVAKDLNDWEFLDSFWDVKKNEMDFSVTRDYSFLKWRFYDHPVNKYELVCIVDCGKIVGYFIYLLKNKNVFIVDIMILNSEISMTLLRQVENFCAKNLDANKITIMISNLKIKKILINLNFKLTGEYNLLINNKVDLNRPMPYITYADYDMV